MKIRAFTSDFVRNFIFGVEDSLVSTVGLVSGIVVAGVSKQTILLTGIILIFVEAFSMSAGSLLSDNATKEFEKRSRVPLAASAASAAVMFISYFFSGLIILAPYAVLPKETALPISIALSLGSLFLLGSFAGRIASQEPLKKGLTMTLIGGMAVGVGAIIGGMIGNL